MGNAKRSFAAFRLTEQEQEEVRRNDLEWALDPEAGELNPKPTDKPTGPKTRPRTFRVPRGVID